MTETVLQPVHPKDHPAVKEQGRLVQESRVALSGIESRARLLEHSQQSGDELTSLLAAQELEGMRERILIARATVARAQREYDERYQEFNKPWRDYWLERYRDAAVQFFEFLEREAVPANEAMRALYEEAGQAGVTLDVLHVPQLSPEAVEHRIRVGRQGLGLP
jgi:hypothetical protein